MHTYKTFVDMLRIAELFACLTGFYHWKKWRGTPWRLYTCYLLFIVLSEALGDYTKEHNLKAANIFVITYLAVPAEFLSAFYIFFATAAGSKMTQRMSVITTLIYMVFWIADVCLLYHPDTVFYSMTYTVGNVLLLILIMRYLLLLAVSKGIIMIGNNILFWICVGWLLFYLGTFPYYALRNTLRVSQPLIYLYYSYLQFVLNICMYLFFAIGFIWGKPKQPYL